MNEMKHIFVNLKRIKSEKNYLPFLSRSKDVWVPSNAKSVVIMGANFFGT